MAGVNAAATPRTRGRMLFGAALVQIGAATIEQIDRALQDSQKTGRKLGATLLADNIVSKNDLIHAAFVQNEPVIVLERRLDFPDFDMVLSEPGSVLKFSDRSENFILVALRHDRDDRAFLIQAHDTDGDTFALTAAQAAIRQKFRVISRIRTSRENLNVVFRELDHSGGGPSVASSSIRVASIQDGPTDQQRRFFDLGRRALKERASDIHIWTQRGTGRIVFRIDGVLEYIDHITQEDAFELFHSIYNTLTETGSTQEGFNRAQMQDAVVEHRYPEGTVRFRYSGMPIGHDGHRVTLRVIPVGATSKPKTFSELGYSTDQCEMLERMFSYSSGLIVVSGTTGSGKSTTIANALGNMAKEATPPNSDVPAKLIATVEQPIEITIPGVLQTAVPGEEREDFLEVLRQNLRSDPDVIGVGEVRDEESAHVTIQAVRSGHLCLTTVHADSAPLVYDRFVGMGVSREDLAGVGLVVGFIYQKLLRVLCERCKVPASDLMDVASPALLAQLERIRKRVGTLEGIYYRNETGCPACKARGVTGRTVCAEILRPTPAILQAVAANDSTGVWRLWRSTIKPDRPADMTGRTAFEHAIYKMQLGLVSPRDVEREFRYLDEPIQGDLE